MRLPRSTVKHLDSHFLDYYYYQRPVVDHSWTPGVRLSGPPWRRFSWGVSPGDSGGTETDVGVLSESRRRGLN